MAIKSIIKTLSTAVGLTANVGSKERPGMHRSIGRGDQPIVTTGMMIDYKEGRESTTVGLVCSSFLSAIFMIIATFSEEGHKVGKESFTQLLSNLFLYLPSEFDNVICTSVWDEEFLSLIKTYHGICACYVDILPITVPEVVGTIFGNGYCSELAIQEWFREKVNVLFGPRLLVADYLRILRVVGRKDGRYKVREERPGYLHMVSSSTGMDPDEFFKFLLKVLATTPDMRIGEEGDACYHVSGRGTVCSCCRRGWDVTAMTSSTELEGDYQLIALFAGCAPHDNMQVLSVTSTYFNCCGQGLPHLQRSDIGSYVGCLPVTAVGTLRYDFECTDAVILLPASSSVEAKGVTAFVREVCFFHISGKVSLHIRLPAGCQVLTVVFLGWRDATRFLHVMGGVGKYGAQNRLWGSLEKPYCVLRDDVLESYCTDMFLPPGGYITADNFAQGTLLQSRESMGGVTVVVASGIAVRSDQNMTIMPGYYVKPHVYIMIWSSITKFVACPVGVLLWTKALSM